MEAGPRGKAERPTQWSFEGCETRIGMRKPTQGKRAHLLAPPCFRAYEAFSYLLSSAVSTTP